MAQPVDDHRARLAELGWAASEHAPPPASRNGRWTVTAARATRTLTGAGLTREAAWRAAVMRVMADGADPGDDA